MSKTIHVRIMVAVDSDGQWAAFGYAGYTDATALDSCFIDDLGIHMSYVAVEADIPVPEVETIQGNVTETKETPL